jgi:hypothetical protein
MDGVENTENTELSTDTSVQETPETTSANTDEGMSSAPETSEGAEGLQAAAPAPEYKPDLKYKVWGEERELDPRIHGLIKSKEDEEWIKKVFSAADGIDHFKAERDEAKQEYTRVMAEVQNVLKAADLGDYQTIFQSIGIPKPKIHELLTSMGYDKDEIIRHAYELAQLTPEQEQYYSRQRELERQNRELQSSLSQTRQQQYEFEVQTKTQELMQTISQPEISPIVQAFDAHHGSGAFWEEVRQRGIAHFALHKRDMPVQQAVNEVVRLIRSGQQASPMQQAATPALQTKSQSLPVIPSVGSGGAQTPARKKPKSLDELKRFAAELSD